MSRRQYDDGFSDAPDLRPATDKPSGGDLAFMELARSRFESAYEAEKDFRDLASDDLKFSVGNADNGYQWLEAHRKSRESDGKPCLTTNRLGQFIHQVTNEQRQNRPGILVSPVDDGADKETADILQGLIRHIESSSSAYVAYATAGDHQVRMGLGYLRLTTEFLDPEDPDNFDQEIKIEPVLDPLSVYGDPNTKKADKSDAEFYFIEHWITEAVYKKLAKGKSEGADLDFVSHAKIAPGWRKEKLVRVAEYFYLERETRTRVKLADGTLAWEDESPKGEVAQSRQVETSKVHWCLIDGVGKLETRNWAGKWIPIIPVPGEEFLVDGKWERFGLVRMAKDPQRMFNIWRSSLTETIGLAPRAPWVGPKEVFEGLESFWRAANIKNFAYLPYNFVVRDGQAMPAPVRNFGEPQIQAIILAGQQAVEDLYGVTGIYPPALGARSNESSGKAILARQRESDVANYHFADNLSRAIEFLGRQLIDLIPKIYDTPRVVRILGEDASEKTVRVNAPGEAQNESGIYDLNVGRYDVAVRTGPSFATKRQAAAEAVIQLTQSDPTLMQWGGDLVFQTLDIPYAEKFAERRKKMLPPELQEDEGGEGQPQIPPQLIAEVQALQQQQQQLVQALRQATAQLEDKAADRASKERIAELNAQVKLTDIASKADLALFTQELALLREEMAAFRQPGPVEG